MKMRNLVIGTISVLLLGYFYYDIRQNANKQGPDILPPPVPVPQAAPISAPLPSSQALPEAGVPLQNYAISHFDQWKEFTPRNGKFTVMFPIIPQHVSEILPFPGGKGNVKYDVYMAQEPDSSVFMISAIQYPEDFDTSDSAMLLDSVMNDMLGGNPQNHLNSKQESQFQNYPSIDFSIINDEYLIRCKAFIQAKNLYVLSMIDHSMHRVDSDFVNFVNSFRINPVAMGEPVKRGQELPPQLIPLPPKQQPQ